ncbi:MAG: insulinase family protein [Fibrobacterota bacterium]
MKEQHIRTGQIIAGFITQDVIRIEETNSIAYILEHKETGAQCIHLYNDDPNNFFSVAFKTPVFDNTGVAHILEHSVLAGSRKYPLKDPFKEMLKGSMQTFLNALTYPDRTVYPVASQVEKDFFNLVDVYCDAVFNPLLRKNTFLQEGWHFDMPRRDAPVSIKGIVYNEMKGVFSDFHSNVARKMLSGIAPDTTYYYESGGDPRDIPTLTYEEFCSFHKKYYHPSNACFVLYGNIPTEKTLSFIQERYLHQYTKQKITASVGEQKKWKRPRTMNIDVPAAAEDDGYATVLVNWMCEGTCDGETGLIGDILSRYFFDGESAPLKRALLDSELGEDLDDMCGYDNDLYTATFSAGLKKVDPSMAPSVLKIVEDTLQHSVDSGPDADLLEGALRRVEFSLREIREGRFPYALQLATRIHRSWLYGGDPCTHIAYEKHLKKLKADFARPGFFEQQVKRFFADNPHRLLMTATGRKSLGEKLSNQTEEQARRLSKDFTQEDKSACYTETQQLVREQQTSHTQEELSVIPVLEKSDIPARNKVVPCAERWVGNTRLFTQPLFTGGITYVDFCFDLFSLSSDLLPYFPLYASYITAAGAGDCSTGEMARRLNLVTGGFSCYDVIFEDGLNEDGLHARAVFSGKALTQNTDALMELFSDVFLRPAFTDRTLLKNILYQHLNDSAHSIVSAGHAYGVRMGVSRLRRSKHMDEILNGVSQYRFLKKLSRTESYDVLLKKLAAIHRRLITPKGLCVNLTAFEADAYDDALYSILDALPQHAPQKPPVIVQSGRENPLALEVSSSVNYVTQSWELNDFSPSRVGAFFILSRVLSTGVLWDMVRVEGGAYGGMALFSSSCRSFSCASFRDPNLADTLKRYEEALRRVAKTVSQGDVDKTMFALASKFDAPKSPHARGISEALARISNNSPERRQAFREAILSCTAADIREIAGQLLENWEKSQIAVVANEKSLQEAQEAGVDFTVEKL